MRARNLVRWSLALALSTLLGGGQVQDRVQAYDARRGSGAAARQVGEHEVSASAPRPGMELALKRGFEVRLRETAGGGPFSLRVAGARASSASIAPAFVPIGPTVELSLAQGRADVSFIADQFRVRSGHRLVLAQEMAAPCAAGASCWQLAPAAYERGRCVALGLPLRGRRLQFGSLPAD